MCFRLILHVRKMIRQSLTDAEDYPAEGITLTSLDTKNEDLRAWIVGPNNSPYEGGLFELSLKIDYSGN